jgi:hypothetical protein
MKRFLFLAVIILFTFFGCAKDNSTTPTGEQTVIRLLNMVYDGGALDLKVNGTLVSSGTAFGTSSGYIQTISGDGLEISVHNAGDSIPRNSSKHDMAEGSAYTLYAFPPNNAFSSGFAADPRSTTPEKARIKLVNACPDTNKFELRITASSSKLLGPIERSRSTTYIDLEAGSYRFSLRNPSDSTFSVEYEAVNLNGQGAYTIVIHGTQDDSDPYPFGIRMFTDNGAGTEYIDWVEAPATSKISFINAVAGSNVHISIDGTIPQIQYLSYPYPSPYLTVASGTHTFSVVSGSTALLANQAIMLDPYKTYSLYITGTTVPANIAPLLFQDRTDPIPGAAFVRFIHNISDAPQLGIYFADIPVTGTETTLPGADKVSFRESGSGTIAAGTYGVLFRDASADTTLFKASDVRLDAAKIYTVWVGGSKSSKTMRAVWITHN